MQRKKVSSFIAMTLDGFIADKKGSVAFLDPFNTPDEDYGYKDFMATKDVVMIGANTFKTVNALDKWWYDGKETYVITSQTFTFRDKNTFAYSGDVKTLIEKVRDEGKGIYCDGGAKLLHTFIQEKLLDELIVSIIPVLLGEGIPLFNSKNQANLVLANCKSYKNGLVQLHYLFDQNYKDHSK